jgi:hypothetical protein
MGTKLGILFTKCNVISNSGLSSKNEITFHLFVSCSCVWLKAL